MKYENMRHLIKSGDMIAFSHVGWKTWHDIKIQMVRMFTQSEYTHVGVAWVVGGRVFVLEAVIPCIRIFPLSKLGDFYHIPMDLNWTPEVEEFSLSLVGQKYSQLQAIGSFFNAPNKDDLWQCCEYVREIYAHAGLHLPGKFTPTGTVLAAQELGLPTFYVDNEAV